MEACPSSHPYAFNEGKQCCKTSNGIFSNFNFTKSTKDTNATCGPIQRLIPSIISTCCENDDFIDCPSGKICVDKELKGNRLIIGV